MECATTRTGAWITFELSSPLLVLVVAASIPIRPCKHQVFHMLLLHLQQQAIDAASNGAWRTHVPSSAMDCSEAAAYHVEKLQR